MVNKSSQNRDSDDERLSKLEDSIRDLSNRMDKEIPAGLSEKLTSLDKNFSINVINFQNEIINIKKGFVDAKATTIERIAFMTIIISLIIAFIIKK